MIKMNLLSHLLLLFFLVSYSTALDASLRTLFLEKHNEFRSLLALGNALNKNGTALPSGANIYHLTYSLEVEEIAQGHADKCVLKHKEIRGTTNNLFAQSPYQPFDRISPEAMNGWWGELHKYGVSDLNFTMDVYKSGVGHWAEVAWWNVLEIGCGIANCPNGLGTPKTAGKKFTYVVCAYNPGGNFLNDMIYEPGPPCSKCDGYENSKCNQTSGLCYVTSSSSSSLLTTPTTSKTLLTTLSTLVTTLSSTLSSSLATRKPTSSGSTRRFTTHSPTTTSTSIEGSTSTWTLPTEQSSTSSTT